MFVGIRSDLLLLLLTPYYLSRDNWKFELARPISSFFQRIAIMQESKYRIRMNDERRDILVKSDSVTVTIGWKLLICRLLSGIRLVLRLEREYAVL